MCVMVTNRKSCSQIGLWRVRERPGAKTTVFIFPLSANQRATEQIQDSGWVVPYSYHEGVCSGCCKLQESSSIEKYACIRYETPRMSQLWELGALGLHHQTWTGPTHLLPSLDTMAVHIETSWMGNS